MMKKKITIIMLTCFMALSVTACAEKEIVVNKDETMAPEFETKEDVTIDWDQVMDDCEDQLNSDDYPLNSYLDFAVHDDTQTIQLIWPLTEDADADSAIAYGEAYIKAFNDAVATQDFSITPSTDDSYGGLWDKYNIDLEVFKESDLLREENYLVYQTIEAGSNAPVVKQIVGDTETTTEAEATSEKANN